MNTTTTTQDKAGLAYARLTDAVSTMQTDEQFLAYLAFQARFHRYSFGNVILLMAQCPTATQVAGYRAWQALGRQVRKGETGLVILAPHRVKKTDELGDETWRLRGFGTATVFDVSQTDGDDPPAICAPLTGSSTVSVAMIDCLHTWCAGEGIRVSMEPLDGTRYGYYRATDRSITVDSQLATDQQAKTFLHEVVHALLHETATTDRHTKEVEAEAVAWIVASACGLDTSDYSVAYVASWQGDTGALLSSGAIIQAAAHVLIDRLSGMREEGEDV